MKLLAAAATLIVLSVAPSAILAASSPKSPDAREAGAANFASDRNLKTKAKSPKATRSPKGAKLSKSGKSAPTPSPTKKNFYNFIPGMLEEVTDSPERLVEIISDLGGNFEGKFAIKEDLLSSQDRASLREHADSELANALEAADKEDERAIQEDFRFELSPSKLASLIAANSIRSMRTAFKDYAIDFPVTRVIIRRTSLTGNKHIQFHNDGDTSVMHVWLNEEDTVDGGNLVYLNKDGATWVQTKPGAAALHKDKIVHGVTPVNGTRYILILLGDNRVDSDVFESIGSNMQNLNTNASCSIAEKESESLEEAANAAAAAVTPPGYHCDISV